MAICTGPRTPARQGRASEGAGGGGAEVPTGAPTVRDAWEALQHVRRLTHTDSGSSTGATAIRVMEPGSVDTYTSALRQALLASTPDKLLVDAVERRLNALAAKRKSGSSATALISGMRLLEKLRIIQAVVTEVHWMQARAIGKRWAIFGPSARWTVLGPGPIQVPPYLKHCERVARFRRLTRQWERGGGGWASPASWADDRICTETCTNSGSPRPRVDS